MRAILVEVPDQAIEASHVRAAEPRAATEASPARGGLAEREARPEDHDPTEGEPW